MTSSRSENSANAPHITEQSVGNGGDVALLIDYENLQISLKRLFNVTTPQMSLIIQEAQEHGRLVLARAYAPWTSPDLAIDAENLYRQGIDLIYVPTGKNSADVRMAVDAVETAGRGTNLTTFVIVTGDGDLIHPLNYLRQHGLKVVVIGVEPAMSRMLSAAADSVLMYERDLDPSVRDRQQRRGPASAGTTTRPTGQPVAPPKSSLTPLGDHRPAEEAFALVRDALQRRGGGEPVLFQELGHWLGQDYSLRPRAWYGVPFSLFMEEAERQGYVAITTSGGNSYAALPGTDHGQVDEPDAEDDSDHDSGTAVRIESLLPEERRDLFEALATTQAGQRGGYLSFRTIRNYLVENSVLPRLSERQVHALLNDLADRTPPILLRSQKRGKDRFGQPFTFSTFTLTTDHSLLEA